MGRSFSFCPPEDEHDRRIIQLCKKEIRVEPEEIEVEPGDQCLHPYECWYYEYCHDGQKCPRD